MYLIKIIYLMYFIDFVQSIIHILVVQLHRPLVNFDIMNQANFLSIVVSSSNSFRPSHCQFLSRNLLLRHHLGQIALTLSIILMQCYLTLFLFKYLLQVKVFSYLPSF